MRYLIRWWILWGMTGALACVVAGVTVAAEAELLIGAATTSITPDQPIALDGQFQTRISKGVDNPITATAVAIEARQGGRSVDQAILVSCDLVAIRPPLLSAARQRLARKLPELDARKVILTATHTHTSGVTEEGKYEIPREGVMQPSQYVTFLVDRLEELIGNAWTQRRPGGVSWGLGQAAVGYNRRAVYANGTAAMYGKTDRADFRGLEGYEDHGLEILFFWNKTQPLAVAVSVACPSQEVESGSKINADFWHDVRRQFQTGDCQNVLVLGWPAAAGDQSPHRMYRKAAEERMLKLRGLSYTQEVARRIVGEINDVCLLVRNDVRTAVPFAHKVENVALPVRKVTEKEMAAAQAEMDALAKKGDATRRRLWLQKVVDRYRTQDQEPTVSIEVHAVRIGDVAIITNPFELFLDYGVQMQGRSKALQTFVIQLTCGSSGYLPTERAVKGGSYSAIVASNLVGPEGGQVLVERSVELINSLW
jgi:lysozyme family protein